jgi:hypothetical protein
MLKAGSWQVTFWQAPFAQNERDQASTGPFALWPSGPIQPPVGLMVPVSVTVATGFAVSGKYFLICLQGSVESCGGVLVKPASNDYPKCSTTTGCNSTDLKYF